MGGCIGELDGAEEDGEGLGDEAGVDVGCLGCHVW